MFQPAMLDYRSVCCFEGKKQVNSCIYIYIPLTVDASLENKKTANVRKITKSKMARVEVWTSEDWEYWEHRL